MLGVGTVGQFRKVFKEFRAWEDRPAETAIRIMIPVEINYPVVEEEKILNWLKSTVYVHEHPEASKFKDAILHNITGFHKVDLDMSNEKDLDLKLASYGTYKRTITVPDKE